MPHGKKLVKVTLTYWTKLPLPGSGSGSPDHELPIEEEDTTPPWGIEEGKPGQGLPEGGRPGHLPTRPPISREEILDYLEEHEDEILDAIEAIKAAIADRIPGIREKLDAIVQEIRDRLDDLANRPVDPGHGVEEGGPSQGLPDRLKAIREAAEAKLEEIRGEVADRIPGVKEKIDIAKRVLRDLAEDIKDKLQGGGGGESCREKIDAIKAEVKAKIEALKQELQDRIPGAKEKLAELLAALEAKIDEIREGHRPGHLPSRPGSGRPPARPDQGGPPPVATPKRR
jgi:hypothetical protein